MPPPVGVLFTPNGINFGNVTASTSSPTMSMLITSIGSQPANINITPNDARYTATPNGNFTLNPGASITVVFQFNASAVLGSSSALFFSFQGSAQPINGPKLAAVTVPGGAAAWNVTPSSINFGSLKVGTSSAPQTVSINNTGSINLIINSISLDASDFSLSGLPTLPVTITPGNHQTFQVIANSTFQGVNDYNPGITITPSTGAPQFVELIYTGFVLTPAFVLTGATQGVLFGFLGQWDNALQSYIAQSLVSQDCEADATWSKMHDFGNASSNTYLSKVFLRNEPSGAVTAILGCTSIISDDVTISTTTTIQTGVNDSKLIPTWMQFDFENNGEICKLDFLVSANNGKMISDLYVLQYEPRGVVYESK